MSAQSMHRIAALMLSAALVAGCGSDDDGVQNAGGTVAAGQQPAAGQNGGSAGSPGASPGQETASTLPESTSNWPGMLAFLQGFGSSDTNEPLRMQGFRAPTDDTAEAAPLRAQGSS